MATQQETVEDKTKNRVLIVDDHPIVRQGLRGLISQAPDLVVCGEAETIFDALKAVEQLKPHIVIVDISLRGESGVDLIKDIRIRFPDLPILTLSMYDEAIYAERVLRAGARGYVTKEEAAENVLQAIRHVLKGQVFLSERMSAKMLSKLVGGKAAAQGLFVDRLSDRELQVFELIGRGMSTRVIAETLHLSVKTVESHRANIKEKLQIQSATELLQQAIHWLQSQG
jgi:DNA-binding NarL/FixJ family response regulator